MARRKTAQPPPFEFPTLRALNDAFLLFFDYATPEGAILWELLARLPEGEALARRNRALSAMHWTRDPVLRHRVRERFGEWGPAGLERVADWLATERPRTADPWGIRLDELHEVLRPAPNSQPVEDLPSLASAADLARWLGLSVDRVEAFLRRYRQKHRGCWREVDGKRVNEPRVYYRTVEVLPALREMTDERRTADFS
jgi:hypothetical protein